MSSVFHWTTPLWDAREFKEMDIGFKVPAILSDGQWYTVDKLRKFTGERPDDVQRVLDGIMTTYDIITNSTHESYRMSYDGLYKWRSENSISLSAQLIPSILYPRIIEYGGRSYTEPEVFDLVPMHRFGQVRFILRSSDDIHGIMRALRGFGRFNQDDDPTKWRITCLSGEVGRSLLEDYEKASGLDLFAEHGHPSVYNTGYQRDINEFKDGLIEPIIQFYQTFRTTSAGEVRPAIMQPSAYRTLKVYMGEEGVVSQINRWIITAIQHYDTDSGVPFAAYLGFLANNRVNDLAGNAIGRNLAKFQNRKARAIKSLHSRSSNKEEWYAPEDIIEEMRRDDARYDLSMEEYNDMDIQLKTWQQASHSTTLEWDETGEEKSTNGFDMTHQLDSFGTSMEHDISVSRIQHAAIHAALETGRVSDCRLLLEMLRNATTIGPMLISSLFADFHDDYNESIMSILGNHG